MRIIKSVAVVALLAAGSAADAAIVGTVPGPDNSFSIGMNFENTMSAAVTKLEIDGGTAMPTPLLWDSAGTVGGTAVVGSSAGQDTRVLVFQFDSFGLGDTFALSGMDPDEDPGDVGVRVSGLLGVMVTAMFSDNSTRAYSFVDDPATGAGLILREKAQVIPLPGAGFLLLGALGALGVVRSRGRKAA